ncbi:MAG: hypothetical protein ACRD3E_19995 [Terriglobales bacterium]
MPSVPKPQIKLTEPFRARPARFLGLWEIGGWRMKAYGLHAENTRLLPELVTAARQLAGEVLPGDAANAYGVGFVGIHCGRDSNFVFIDWWANQNELHHHVFVSSVEEPLRLARAPEGLSSCVWDLQLMWFERNVWVDKVLNNSRGPDIEAYLKKVLDDA